jgi:hypothetical protein
MSYKIQLVNEVGRLDYIRGLSEAEALMICEQHQWTYEDEAGGLWSMAMDYEGDSDAEV